MVGWLCEVNQMQQTEQYGTEKKKKNAWYKEI